MNPTWYGTSKEVDDIVEKTEYQLGLTNTEKDAQKIEEIKRDILQLVDLSLDPFQNQQSINATRLEARTKLKYFEGKKLSKRDLDTFTENADQFRLHIMELFDSGMNVNFIINQKKMVEKLQKQDIVKPGEMPSNNSSTVLDDIPRSKRYNIDFFESDLQRLSNNDWFNDKLINFWLNLLTEVKSLKLNGKFDQKTALIPSWCFSTLTKNRPIDKITEDELDFKGASYFLQEKAREASIKSGYLLGMVERIFFIINISNQHWIMVEVKRNFTRLSASPSSNNVITTLGKNEFKPEFELVLYDPMSEAYTKTIIFDHPILKFLREFIKYEIFYYERRNVRDHEFYFTKAKVTQQKNLFDCGPYICKYAHIVYLDNEPYTSEFLKKIQANEIKSLRKQYERMIIDIGFSRDLPGYIQKFII